MKQTIKRILRPTYRKLYRFYHDTKTSWNTRRTEREIQRLIPIMKIMADTGVGTDECLKNGFLPMPIHFYSPVLDIPDLEARQMWNRVSPLTGIDQRVDAQLELLAQLGKGYGNECAWPQNETKDVYQFYTHNGGFSYGCAAALHTMIRNYKPSRVIEVGSGNSSRVISAAALKNIAEGHPCQYTIIDPYPWPIIEDGLPGLSRMVKGRVELQDLGLFDELEENDILFIDSGHTVRLGGDVNFLYLEVLPKLKPGVIVHIHDIGLPYEYAKVYATNPRFRVFWTEAYLLQAFLAFNSAFEILLMMNMLQTQHMDAFCAAFPPFDLATNWATSGSFWIRRKLEE
jgi:hypothetical protein